MAVNLIRKNNGVGITAYQDAVLFHFAKGANGVIEGVHEEFEASYDNAQKKLTVASGMGIIYGRQFEIAPGEVIEFDYSSLAGTRYIVVYAEVDLRDPTNEVASLKAIYTTGAYPGIAEGDNLISVPNGIHRMLMYHVLKTDDGATIAPQFSLLQNDSISHSELATEADHAADSTTINGVNMGYNSTKKAVTVQVPGSQIVEVIERKELLYARAIHGNDTAEIPVAASFVDLVAGEVVEIIYNDSIFRIKLLQGSGYVHGNRDYAYMVWDAEPFVEDASMFGIKRSTYKFKRNANGTLNFTQDDITQLYKYNAGKPYTGNPSTSLGQHAYVADYIYRVRGDV